MDVSQLSISIDVDMSDFTDAMAKISAMLTTLADQFKNTSAGISQSLAGIGASGDQGKNLLSTMVSTNPVQSAQQLNEAQDEVNQSTRESVELYGELQSTATSAFSTIGDALGKMMAGQKGVNPLAAIMKQMADALKKYGEFLITAGTAMLFGGDPLGGAKVGEGIALEAVGTAMGTLKLAQGGIVSGSTFANIGEYAGASHNPEVVAPLDKLKSMVGNGGGTQHYSFEMQGDKIVAVLQRIANNNSFVLGSS